jgi:hypothetical protein
VGRDEQQQFLYDLIFKAAGEFQLVYVSVR